LDNALGKHIILEVWGEVAALPFWNMDEAAAVFVEASKDAGATVITERWHHFGSGHGYTGVVVLAESHISVHTWPEKGYAAVDIFMCGNADPQKSVGKIVDFYKSKVYDVRVLKRGMRLAA
jgi:S-adenosylmethionine decarboxylase